LEGAQEPTAIRVRRVRTAFQPQEQGSYRLPEEVRSRLIAALKPCRNRAAAFALATFLGQLWGTPGRAAGPFHIVRRTVAGRDDLGLSESAIRKAIATLEDVGFITRLLPPGA
jgi:hypothetical protein